jgi:hypothetical protein
VSNGLSGAFVSRTPRTFQVTGREGIPEDAVAVTGNLTVTQQTSSGYLTLGATATATPTTLTLVFPRGDNRPVMTVVRLGEGGTLGLVFVGAAGATAHAIFDVTGYFRPGPGGAVYVPLPPTRFLDSRFGNGLSGPFASGVPRSFEVRSRLDVPASAVAISGNATVTQQTTAGYATVAPTTAARPSTSTLNFPVGDNRANGLIVPLHGDGSLSAVFVGGSAATTHLILDVTGYFAPAE